MPRGDGTGPEGAGPMTGRAAGYCAGNNAPGFTGQVPPQAAPNARQPFNRRANPQMDNAPANFGPTGTRPGAGQGRGGRGRGRGRGGDFGRGR